MTKPPGVFWVSLIFGLSAALPQFLALYFPTNTYWWSYALIIALNILVVAIWTAWPKTAKKASEGIEPAQAPIVGDINTSIRQLEEATPISARQSTWKDFVF